MIAPPKILHRLLWGFHAGFTPGSFFFIPTIRIQYCWKDGCDCGQFGFTFYFGNIEIAVRKEIVTLLEISEEIEDGNDAN